MKSDWVRHRQSRSNRQVLKGITAKLSRLCPRLLIALTANLLSLRPYKIYETDENRRFKILKIFVLYLIETGIDPYDRHSLMLRPSSLFQSVLTTNSLKSVDVQC
jgi:hypothetical protein